MVDAFLAAFGRHVPSVDLFGSSTPDRVVATAGEWPNRAFSIVERPV